MKKSLFWIAKYKDYVHMEDLILFSICEPKRCSFLKHVAD